MSSLADILIDTVETLPGNAENARKALSDAVTNDSPDDNSTSKGSAAVADDVLPAKFKGKTAAEIAEMYANLESRLGSMANDLGVQRQLTDRLLDVKRTSDLSQNDPNARQAVKPKPMTTAELLDNPDVALDRVMTPRVDKVSQDITALRQEVQAARAESAFRSKHNDFETVVKDPEFISWVQASPLRLRAAGAANQGNWDVAADLLSEFKTAKPSKAVPSDDEEVQEETRPARNLRAARNVSLESSNSSGGTNSVDGPTKGKGKIFSRADLMRLRIQDPEAYYDEAFQAVILRAYDEDRVK